MEASTSPAVVEDLRPVVDELKGRLVKTLKDLEYCKEELAEANSVIGARSSEVERWDVLVYVCASVRCMCLCL